jgi:Fic family protein
MAAFSSRAGRFVKQPAGYTAFIPAPLPPDPPLQLDLPLLGLLSRADQAIGRLDGIAETLPNPDLFVAMYVRQEAVLSSQIEGTQSTLDDVLAFELDERARTVSLDVEEVVNYVRAMNYGLARLAELPLSLRLIREIHGELLRGVRGAERTPGEFRRSQNWIGAGHVPLDRARFVPPPPAEMGEALDSFEKFLHASSAPGAVDGPPGLPALVHCGLAHAQFETIHPFLDGNGRVGRLLITFLLCHGGVLRRPLLYLSHYLKRYRGEYYDRLMAIRENGDWEGWLRFFLRGVADTAEQATATAQAIVGLRERHRALVQEAGGVNGLRLLDLLFQQPLVHIPLVSQQLGVSFVTAGRLVEQLVHLGLLEETTGRQRSRRFRYSPYLRHFTETGARNGDGAPIQATDSPAV